MSGDGTTRSDGGLTGVMVVDADWAWRTGVEVEIARTPGLALIPGHSSPDPARAAITESPPDLLILGSVFRSLGGSGMFGISLAWELRWKGVPARLVIMSADPTVWECSEAAAAGAAAFVPKGALAEPADLRRVLQRVCDGHRVFAFDDPASRHGITPAEVAVLVAIRDGLPTHEIGMRLKVSRQTVNNRVHSIGMKLGVSGRATVLAAALRLGIVTSPRTS